MTRRIVIAVCLMFLAAGALRTAHADTLDAVRAAGVLRCGSNGASEDYTRLDTHGDLSDLAAEICRALAAAVLGPNGKTDLHVWPDELHMLASVRDRTTDVAIGAAPTVPNEVAFGVSFEPPVFYDGQGLLAANGAASLADLAGQPICFVDDASLGETLSFAMAAHGLAYKPFAFSEVNEMLSAAAGGRCGAITGNVSQLINMRVGLAGIEQRYALLPAMLTSDPVAPATRADDRRWALVVASVVNLLVQAEASGVTAANVEQMQESDDPVVRKLIGPHNRLGSLMGLPDEWATSVLKSVGNYGEIFARSLGAESDFKLARGANRPWSSGGLMYPAPLD